MADSIQGSITYFKTSGRQNTEELVVSEGTVRFHVSNILSKLHLANRTQAALYALQEGLSSLD